MSFDNFANAVCAVFLSLHFKCKFIHNKTKLKHNLYHYSLASIYFLALNTILSAETLYNLRLIDLFHNHDKLSNIKKEHQKYKKKMIINGTFI